MPGDLTQRFTVFVQKQGTDAAGANAVGAPDSRLTIAAALADLAANYPPATAAAPHIVALGPGDYQEGALAWPPFTFLNGECDGEGQPTTILRLTGNITLSVAWAINQTQSGGFSNVTIRAAAGAPILDFTLPVPLAGNPARTVILENVRHNLTQEIFEATSTADALQIYGETQDGVLTDTFTQIGGTSTISNRSSAAAMTIRDKTSFAAAGIWRMVSTGTGAGITANSIAAAGCTLRLTASNPRTLTISETAPGAITVLADSASIPIIGSVTFTGTATTADLSRISDANGEGYTPAVPANWAVVPTTVQEALDSLAGGGGVGPITTNYILRTGNRSSAAWGVAGVAINSTPNTFTDSTSAGVVATAVTVSFGVPTFAAAVATTYTNAANVYIAGAPAAGTNVALTSAWALWVVGVSRFDDFITGLGLTGFAATSCVISGGSSGASLTVESGANANANLIATGTGYTFVNTKLAVNLSNPGARLAVDVASSSLVIGTDNVADVINSNTTVGNLAGIRFNQSNNVFGASIAGIHVSRTGGARVTDLGFFPMTASVAAERMRLTGGGNLLVGTTTDPGSNGGLVVAGIIRAGSTPTPLTNATGNLLTLAGNTWGTYAATTTPAIVFAAVDQNRTHLLTGDTVYSASGYAQGFILNLFILCDGTPRNLTFPAWTWVGGPPTTIAAGKTMQISAVCRDGTAGGVVAAYAVEP